MAVQRERPQQAPVHPAQGCLPAPAQLAALGTVLCLYRALHGSELAGWQQAVRVEARAGLHSDGLDEQLLFFDAQDRCCWRLCLLPESDFLAWDRLLSSLPCAREEPAGGLGERLWQRLAVRLRGGQWRASAVHLHALPQAAGSAVLAASLPPLSPLGLATARRIAAAEGIDADGALDECCCARSAVAAASIAAQFAEQERSAGHDDNVVPLVRFK